MSYTSELSPERKAAAIKRISDQELKAANNIKQDELNKEFFKAVKSDNVEAVKESLKNGANIHANESGPEYGANEDGLRLACMTPNKEMVEFLLDNGADLKFSDNLPLILTCHRGHDEIVNLLLDRGADIHANEDQAIKDAASFGNLSTVNLLIDRGANFRDEEDMALRCAASNGHSEIVQLLLDKGADVHARNDCALEWAAEEGHTETVKILLNHGADIHVDHDSPLKSAAEEGNIETVSLMIVDFNMKVKPETKAYLQDRDCEDALKILNSRDLSNKISSSLKPKVESVTQTKKMKL